MVNNNFEIFEKKVDHLLSEYETLLCGNKRLEEEIRGKEKEIRELKKTIETIEREKGIAKEKVEVLIERLDVLLQGA